MEELQLPPGSKPPKPRTAYLRSHTAIGTYQNALLAALADLTVSPEELEALNGLRVQLELPAEVVRAVHARVFAMALTMVIDDDRLDGRERSDLARMWACLNTLGWAPGG